MLRTATSSADWPPTRPSARHSRNWRPSFVPPLPRSRRLSRSEFKPETRKSERRLIEAKSHCLIGLAHRSAVLKATTLTGLSYCPESRSVIVVSRSARSGWSRNRIGPTGRNRRARGRRFDRYRLARLTGSNPDAYATPLDAAPGDLSTKSGIDPAQKGTPASRRRRNSRSASLRGFHCAVAAARYREFLASILTD
jgi:hypothetical protein